jgi:hypothetical protein
MSAFEIPLASTAPPDVCCETCKWICWNQLFLISRQSLEVGEMKREVLQMFEIGSHVDAVMHHALDCGLVYINFSEMRSPHWRLQHRESFRLSGTFTICFGKRRNR